MDSHSVMLAVKLPDMVLTTSIEFENLSNSFRDIICLAIWSVSKGCFNVYIYISYVSLLYSQLHLSNYQEVPSAYRRHRPKQHF